MKSRFPSLALSILGSWHSSCDLDLPAECDDEYWEPEDPSQAFIQPSGRPSKASFLVYWTKLFKISRMAMRSLYSPSPPKPSLNVDPKEWEKQIISELDSALNDFEESLPEHLRWNPDIKEPTFLIQSANLRAFSCNLRIFIHRPFLTSSPKNLATLDVPSLTICTSAARSCLQALETATHATGLLLPYAQGTAMYSCVVLIIHLCVAKTLGRNSNDGVEMDLLRKVSQTLGRHEQRYILAGRYNDLLNQLLAIMERIRQAPAQSPPRNLKRPREEEHESSLLSAGNTALDRSEEGGPSFLFDPSWVSNIPSDSTSNLLGVLNSQWPWLTEEGPGRFSDYFQWI